MCILPGNFREISFHFYFPNFWEHIWSICVSVHGVMFCTQPYMETNSYHIKMKRWQHLHFGINDNDNLDKNSMCAESEWLIMHPITKSMILSHSMLYGFLWSGTEEVFKDELIFCLLQCNLLGNKRERRRWFICDKDVRQENERNTFSKHLILFID